MQNDLHDPKELDSRIIFIRGQHVMLDADLARLYQVETRSINQAVRRNLERFPQDFMFQLTDEERQILRSQNVILRSGEWGKHPKYLPYAFTEQGVSMLSSVLKSKTAVMVNIAIMRTFVKMREVSSKNVEFIKKLESLEKKYAHHDRQFEAVFAAIRKIIESHHVPSQKRIKGLSK